MRAQYPNQLKLTKYVKALAWEYRDKYPEFSVAQIDRPIDVVVNSVDFEINEFQSITVKSTILNTLNRILSDGKTMYELRLSQALLRVLNFHQGAEEVIRHYVVNRGKVEFPESEKEKYMDFISEMTERVVNDVCRETELKISKMSDKENRLNSREEEGDFAVKVSEREADGHSSKKSKFGHAH